MDTQLRAGVIGVGALGRHHARLYKQNEKVKTVGIFDVNRETAEAVGREFDIPVFDDWKKLADSCDLLSVAVPAIYHEECTIPLLNMGKHVLVEKPIASTVADAELMVEAAHKNNVILAVGHTERFNPAMDFLEKYKKNTRFIEAHRLACYPPPRPGTAAAFCGGGSDGASHVAGADKTNGLIHGKSSSQPSGTAPGR